MKSKIISLHIPTQGFKSFLKSITKINNSIIIKVKDYKMEVLTASDGGSIILLSTLSIPEIEDNNVEIELPIIDINKLLKICDFANDNEIILTIDDNVIKYKNDIIKLKFYLAEESIITVPAQVTPEKFRSFPISFSTNLYKDKINQLEKGYGFIKSTSGEIKVYFYTEDDKFYGELTDYASQSIDSFKISLSDTFNGQLNGRIPIKLDNWNLMDLSNSEIIFEASEVRRKTMVYNILFIKQYSDNLEYSYLIQGLKN